MSEVSLADMCFLKIVRKTTITVIAQIEPYIRMLVNKLIPLFNYSLEMKEEVSKATMR
jgi:hypothetical protein